MTDDTNNLAERLAKMPQEWWQKVARAATEGYGFKLGTVEASRAVKKAAAKLAPLLSQVPPPATSPASEAGRMEALEKWRQREVEAFEEWWDAHPEHHCHDCEHVGKKIWLAAREVLSPAAPSAQAKPTGEDKQG